MLSVATVRSAKGAAGYFAADNYYAAAEAEQSGEWVGKGAAALGLKGPVDKDSFEALLRGELPDGSRVGTAGRHRAGIDLTFSLPKSWSLLALVGGDRRIIEAYRAAVKETLAWAEANAAETRLEVKGKERIVATGNLAVALFEHDTSREQEPQAHLHAVVANVTQGPDGKWRALHNEKLWSLNTLLNAIAMSSFRQKVQVLGYEIGERGKHGNFEAAGIPRAIILAFSTRRQQILAKVGEMRARTPEAFAAATLMTRTDKAPVADRDALYQGWREAAASAGIDLPAILASAEARATQPPSPWQRLGIAADAMSRGIKGAVVALSERLGLEARDPYLPRGLHRLAPDKIAAAHAVASGLRHLGQREAAFKRTDIYKAALDTGLPASIADIESRISSLIRGKQLVMGSARGAEMMTTAQAIATEQRMLREVEAGRDQGGQFLPRTDAAALLKTKAEASIGITLNPGQLSAGAMLLGSPDRIIAIQGVAGAGKSSMLAPAARLIEERSQQVLGLAVQNTLVQMLQRETGVPSMTVARFLKRYEALLEGGDGRLPLDAPSLKGAAILVDEASMLSNSDQLKLVTLANRLGVGRMAFVGDARQLGAVDAGKPFSVMQQAGAPTAHMAQNLRARGEAIKVAAAAAQIGNVERAMDALAPFTIEAPGRGAQEAAERWLALGADERARTAIYASGRRLRGEANAAVQAGLIDHGELGPGRLDLDVLDRISMTDEELRYTHSYAPGMIVEISRAQRAQRLPRARAEVTRVDPKSGAVHLRLSRGREVSFRPDRLRPNGRSPLQLYERKALTIHEGDRIRWTANDHKRGLFNADQARVTAIGDKGISVETSLGVKVELSKADPMLTRLDLAYALNAHMAQGLTSDRGIAVMETRDRKLANQQTFLVTVTRLRDALTLVVDRASALERQLIRNPGGKTSALETAGGVRPPSPGAPPSASPARKPVPDRGLEPDGGRTRPWEIGI
ncbi:conjugative relaxase [Sphingomonas sp. ID1715]|uniref:MobF family relaxase n=1 Tax=Sphingomonas sp. ID1715 TaxID=1656898 RepID=UPI0014884406|nr:MobF family relaxase [Sphingomonas sp. ID1715]NNM78567.1 conjugative relaxase [Sphingomonas sp. ID1715]